MPLQSPLAIRDGRTGDEMKFDVSVMIFSNSWTPWGDASGCISLAARPSVGDRIEPLYSHPILRASLGEGAFFATHIIDPVDQGGNRLILCEYIVAKSAQAAEDAALALERDFGFTCIPYD